LTMTALVKNNLITAIDKIYLERIQPLLLPIVEANVVPDAIIRYFIRRETWFGLKRVRELNAEQASKETIDFIAEIKQMPIAVHQQKANEQHYEVPDSFYRLVLGPHLKYSSGYWPSEATTLEESEVAMLEMYCTRAELADGMSIIDLGCGWGSVSLYVAAKYPNAQITSISNSNSQREFILATAKKRGLSNIQVFTGDINSFDLPADRQGTADRVISIEMFEHMKNYEKLMLKVSRWIKPLGKLFVHIFTGREVPEHFGKGWMAENFFSGGTMPSDHLLLYFQDQLKIEGHWRINGKHYQRTLEAWLDLIDQKKAQVMPILSETYGEKNATKWFVNWRLFFIGCAEFFGIDDGNAYQVSHYLFQKR